MTISSCAQRSAPLPIAETSTVWPEPPAAPRIQYLKSFSNPENLGITKSFWQKIVEFFSGAEQTQMIRPSAVTVDSNANQIYVADPGAKGIHRFDLKNGSYRLLRRKDNQPLPSPVGLVSGDNGEVFITDSALGGLYKANSDSRWVMPVRLDVELKQPTGIAYDKVEKKIFIADTSEHDIKVFSLSGTFLNKIGKRGNKEKEFNFPTMLWVDEKKQLYITDSLNFRIQVLDQNGDYITQFGRLGDASGTFSRPRGVATDRSGHIYVVDSMFHSFQIFNNKGNLLLHIGRQGQEPGEFWLPGTIFIAPDDTIYIADSHNKRVQVFRYIGGAP
ncbi:MAG: 6-bladed beta-propeller [Gammaproteobacteria bacterium]|nr:6-bladed beta-propeller [Gammaproteobacteria bacterium]